MRKFAFTKSKNSGFSLMEVLVVVAILAIMVCLAVPNIIAYSRSITLTALDDSAHSIFMTAQSKLSVLKNSGEETVIASLGDTTVKDSYIAVSDKDKLSVLVAAGSVDTELFGHDYVVEIDPKSGTVYAVWYWENGSFNYEKQAYGASDGDLTDKSTRLQSNIMVGYYGGTSVNRPDIMQTPIPTVEVINAEELQLRISASNKGLDLEDKLVATVTLVGKDGKSKQIVTKAELKRDSVNQKDVGTVVLDTLSEEKYFNTANSFNDFYYGNIGKSFDKWAQDSSFDADDEYIILPGDNFDIEVKVEVENKNYLPQYAYKHNVNGLFADKNENTALIAYGRHLQNLSNDKSSVTEARQIADIDFGKVSTTDSVYSWANTYGTESLTPIANTNLVGYNGERFIIANLNVSQENNAGLFETISDNANLADIYLRDATVKGSANVGALIGEAKNLNVSGCRVWLTDPQNKDTRTLTGNVAGGLVGAVSGSLTLQDSFASAYLQGDVLGGLVGILNGGKIETSYAAGYLCANNGEKSFAGGLVGQLTNNLAIDDSYAAGIIGAANFAGGLIADAKSTPLVQRSYVAVRYSAEMVNSSATVYGTFFGDESTEYISQMGVKYGTGGTPVTSFEMYVSGGNTATDAEKSTITKPYKLLSETSLENVLSTNYPYQKVRTSSGFLPHYGDWLEESEAFMLYYEQYDDKAGTYGLYANHERFKINTLKQRVDDADLDNRTYVIDDGYALFILSTPETNNPTLDVLIGDDNKQYKLEEFKFKIEFRGAQVDCVMYRISEPTLTISPDWTSYDEAGGLLTQPILHYYTKLTYTVMYEDDYGFTYENPYETKTYYFNPHFACEVFEVKPKEYGNDVVYSAKPGAEGVGETSASPDEPSDWARAIVIRSARHLSNLHCYTNTATPNSGTDRGIGKVKCATIDQLLDIDFKKYTDAKLLSGGGDSDNRLIPAVLWKGTYDGHECVIRNVYLNGGVRTFTRQEETCYSMGLFAKTDNATLKNIRIVNATGFVNTTIPKTGTTYIGGLVGYADDDSTVDNCGIYTENALLKTIESPTRQPYYRNFAISCSETNTVLGGLIGYSANSKIYNSFAAIKVFGHTVGGFIGQIGAGTIVRDCYSAGYTKFADYYENLYKSTYDKAHTGSLGNINGYPAYAEEYGTDTCNVGGHGGSAGGFAGIVDGGVTFEGICYTTCSVRNGNTQLGLFAGNANVFTYKDATLYATGIVISSTSTTETFDGKNYSFYSGDKPRSENYLSSLENIKKNAGAVLNYNYNVAKVYTYNDSLKEFPYPSNLTSHYGDWV